MATRSDPVLRPPSHWKPDRHTAFGLDESLFQTEADGRLPTVLDRLPRHPSGPRHLDRSPIPSTGW
ncbi:hypothetical protein AB0G02_27450, partial [Actinosynnema sp. NPDC023658]|uniref:hypothetical protein n=1 Tax=Actinosynnema sp. NPDC023658 TaxID=3155465 RepID=UPI0033D3B4AA